MNKSEIERRMERAIIKRFGKSIMPYNFRELAPVAGSHVFQMTDTESGHWIKASVKGNRLHVWAEHDAEAEH